MVKFKILSEILNYNQFGFLILFLLCSQSSLYYFGDDVGDLPGDRFSEKWQKTNWENEKIFSVGLGNTCFNSYLTYRDNTYSIHTKIHIH